MQQNEFIKNMFILDIEPYDAILGLYYKAAHSVMTFHYRNLQLVFDNDGDQVLLYGVNSKVLWGTREVSWDRNSESFPTYGTPEPFRSSVNGYSKSR